MKTKRLFAGLVSAIVVLAVISCNVFAVEMKYMETVFTEDNMMTIYLSHPPANISKVECYIGGNECEYISGGFVEGSGEKIQTLFFIDTTKSISMKMRENINEFMTKMIESKAADDEYAICTFTGKVNYISEFESDRYELGKAVESLEYSGEASYIYDGLKTAINDMKNNGENCYKKIVIITDGEENSAVGSLYDDIRDVIKEEMITIDAICIKDEDNVEELKVISSFVNLTNGNIFRISDDTNATTIADAILNNYKGIYKANIKVPSGILDGGIKNVQVEISSPDGSSLASADIRMPMVRINAETEQVTEITSESMATTVENSDNKSTIIIMLIIVMSILLICVIAIMFVVLTNKRGKQEERTAVDDDTPDNDETVFVGMEDSGETMFLFASESTCTISLIDQNDTQKTFNADTRKDIIVGRSAERATLVIDYDKSVSKAHCRIYEENGKVFVQDLNSANKTYVNGIQVVDNDELTDGCHLKIGRLSFTVKISAR